MTKIPVMLAAILSTSPRSVAAFASGRSAASIRRSFSSSIASSSSALSAALSSNLVSVDDCLAAFGDDNVKFIDGSWHLANDRDGRSDYEAGPRISGAKFFDIDDISTKGEANPKGLPHMMPPKNLFAAAMDALNVSNENHLVVYGTEGCMFTARCFYTLRGMGHAADKGRRSSRLQMAFVRVGQGRRRPSLRDENQPYCYLWFVLRVALLSWA